MKERKKERERDTRAQILALSRIGSCPEPWVDLADFLERGKGTRATKAFPFRTFFFGP